MSALNCAPMMVVVGIFECARPRTTPARSVRLVTNLNSSPLELEAHRALDTGALCTPPVTRQQKGQAEPRNRFGRARKENRFHFFCRARVLKRGPNRETLAFLACCSCGPQRQVAFFRVAPRARTFACVPASGGKINRRGAERGVYKVWAHFPTPSSSASLIDDEEAQQRIRQRAQESGSLVSEVQRFSCWPQESFRSLNGNPACLL